MSVAQIPDETRLIPIIEAAEILRVSPQTVRRLIDEGRLGPTVEVRPRKLRLRLSDVRRFVDSL